MRKLVYAGLACVTLASATVAKADMFDRQKLTTKATNCVALPYLHHEPGPMNVHSPRSTSPYLPVRFRPVCPLSRILWKTIYDGVEADHLR